MESELVIALALRLGLGAVTTFLAIMLWSHTRESAWMLVILGIIFIYGSILYETLSAFGILPGSVSLFGGPVTVELLLENIPLLLFSGGFVVMIVNSRR